MMGATGIKLAESTHLEPAAADGTPSLPMQRLWFSLQRLEWASLVLVPADSSVSVEDFAQPLFHVGRLAMGERLRLIDAREVKLNRTAPLILDMTGGPRAAHDGTRWNERVVVMVESVLSAPSGVPVVLAADAALLCVELGKTKLAAARETLSIVGAQRFVGSVTRGP